METLDKCEELKSKLPEYSFKYIYVNDKVIPFDTFLKDNFLNSINGSVSIDAMANYIRTNNAISVLIDKAEHIRKIDEIVSTFIQENPFFKSVIQISPETVIDTKDEIKSYAHKFMDKDGNLTYAGKKISLAEYYEKLLQNEYRVPSIEDKRELLLDMCSRIEPRVLDSIMDGMNITVRDYLVEKLPSKMSMVTSLGEDKLYVLVDNQRIDIEEFIVKIVEHQHQILEQEEDKKRQEAEDKFNKTGDNPNLVSEIQVKLSESNNLEITAELPVVESSNLNEDEVSSLAKNYHNLENESYEDYFTKQLNSIKEAIDRTDNELDLKSKETLFESIANDGLAHSQYIDALIDSIRQLINVKRNNIIKTNNNSEELIDVLFSEKNRISDELRKCDSLDGFNKLYGEAINRYRELIDKNIKDIQLESAYLTLMHEINKNRLKFDSTLKDKNQDVERTKAELDNRLIDIKQDLLAMEYDPNNLANLQGTKIRVEQAIRETKEALDNAVYNKLLQADEIEYYASKLKTFEGTLNVGYRQR